MSVHWTEEPSARRMICSGALIGRYITDILDDLIMVIGPVLLILWHRDMLLQGNGILITLFALAAVYRIGHFIRHTILVVKLFVYYQTHGVSKAMAEDWHREIYSMRDTYVPSDEEGDDEAEG